MSTPVHPMATPLQPNPLQVEKFGPNPTRPTTTNKFNCLVQQNLIHLCFKCINIILSHFSTFAIVDLTTPNPPKTEKSRPNPTRPMGQPNPWTTLTRTNPSQLQAYSTSPARVLWRLIEDSVRSRRVQPQREMESGLPSQVDDNADCDNDYRHRQRHRQNYQNR